MKSKPLPVRSVRLSSAEWAMLGKLARGRKVSRGRWIAWAVRNMALGGPVGILTDQIEKWLEQRTGVVVQDEPGNARSELLGIIQEATGRRKTKPGPNRKGKQ